MRPSIRTKRYGTPATFETVGMDLPSLSVVVRLADQAIRRCYDDFYIADCGRPAELRTIRVEKAAVLKRHVEDGIRRELVHPFDPPSGC